jgi:hypothetical protein
LSPEATPSPTDSKTWQKQQSLAKTQAKQDATKAAYINKSSSQARRNKSSIHQ